MSSGCAFSGVRNHSLHLILKESVNPRRLRTMESQPCTKWIDSNVLANFLKSLFPIRWFCFSELISLVSQPTLGERNSLWKVTLTFKARKVSFGAFLSQQLLPFECLQSSLQPSLQSPWGLIRFLIAKWEDLQRWLTRRPCFGNFRQRSFSLVRKFTPHDAEQGMTMADDNNRIASILYACQPKNQCFNSTGYLFSFMKLVGCEQYFLFTDKETQGQYFISLLEQRFLTGSLDGTSGVCEPLK